MNHVFGNADHRCSQRAEGMRERGPLWHGGHRHHGHGNADAGAQDQADGDVDIVVNIRVKKRAKHSGGHAGRSHDHAAARGVRMAEPLQAKDEEARSDQVCGFKKILSVAHFFSSGLTASFLRNILSMRSVMRKPPVTLIMAEVTAAQPRIEASIWCWS